MTQNLKPEINKKRVALHTLGCRLNFSETGSIAKGFQERGYEIVDFGESADVSFINTCTVTDGADSTCRNLIRKAHRASPEGKIVVAGCYAQMDAERISKMTGVDLVLGTSEKYKVFDYLDEDQDQVVHIDKSVTFYGAATSEAEGHTRAFLKIQDGCNYVCSFCIIPQARGRSRALPVKDALENAKRLLGEGFKEIVLTGVNIGEYEANTGERLSDLVYQLLELKELKRLRLGSVEPNTLNDDLLEAFASSPKFLEHFHIPLQSGDDTILKDMRRKYTVEQYRTLIEKVVSRFPDAGIGADVICGFPGETEKQFKNTYNLLKELPITHFHVFPYSSRKNTTAARMENQIQHGVKKERVRTLKMFGEAKLRMFAEDQVGSSTEVLFERRNEYGMWEGYTRNYVRVAVASDADLKNHIHHIYLKDFNTSDFKGDLLIGEILN
jgi:threonylcarbamoyladenosine tRNA methylthiotransferase MtaB